MKYTHQKPAYNVEELIAWFIKLLVLYFLPKSM